MGLWEARLDLLIQMHTKIGPLLTGLSNSAQIVRVGANVSEVVTMALFAAYSYDTPEKSLTETKKEKLKKKSIIV